MMNLYFTQIDPVDPHFCDLLSWRGWHCRHLPMRRVVLSEAAPDWDPDAFDALILTSKSAARWLLKWRLDRLPPLAVVGESTRALLPGKPMLLAGPAPANADALADRLCRHFHQGPARLLFLKGASASDTLAHELQHHVLAEQVVYRTEKLSQKLPTPPMPAMVYFQAPSTVFDYQEIYHNPPTHVAAIGNSTARAVEAAGWHLGFQPSRPETRCFVTELPAAREWELS